MDMIGNDPLINKRCGFDHDNPVVFGCWQTIYKSFGVLTKDQLNDFLQSDQSYDDFLHGFYKDCLKLDLDLTKESNYWKVYMSA
jgi:hypothetical protein